MFAGSSTMNQLDKIMDVTGMPEGFRIFTRALCNKIRTRIPTPELYQPCSWISGIWGVFKIRKKLEGKGWGRRVLLLHRVVGVGEGLIGTFRVVKFNL
jgi:hypothetical protein